MKSFLLFLSLSMLCGTASAQEIYTATPPPLKDATIEVHLKSGKVNKFSENTYKVVSRDSSKKVQELIDGLRRQLAEAQKKLRDAEAALAAEAAKQPTVKEVKVVQDVDVPVLAKPNRIEILGGVGPDGVMSKSTGSGETVEPRTSPLVGAAYSRRLNRDWSVGGEVMTGVSPQTRTVIGALKAGYDF